MWEAKEEVGGRSGEKEEVGRGGDGGKREMRKAQQEYNAGRGEGGHK